MPQPVAPFMDRIRDAPVPHDLERAHRDITDLLEIANAEPNLTTLISIMAKPGVKRLLSAIFGASPYLTRLMLRRPEMLLRCLSDAPESRFASATASLNTAVATATNRDDVMRALRFYKAEMALLTALCDLSGAWPVMTVTRVLSETADNAVRAALRYLFAEAQRKGDWLDPNENPEDRSGFIILAMGKHGAFELNYSSDIDLIVFYEPSRAQLNPRHEVQQFFVRLTRDLVKFMQEQTADGYVFRTDLRLRPDPGATPVALSVEAALIYYETVGQNWERAAMIKARAIAGDIEAGQQCLRDLAPFIWRKYLDFAAIADIHAMKRQIHAVKGFGHIAVAGHDIKVGRGGIREIEFFAQTQQLIAGGRQTNLRISGTLPALNALVERGWLKADVKDELIEAYIFLRRIEHRLQMLADEQTQTLPTDQETLDILAHFSGFGDFEQFSTALTQRLQRVQRHYARLFEDSPALTAADTNMVFAGEADDPATVKALSAMGYKDPHRVIEGVRGWHHGRVRAIRSPRARELLTEVQPRLIEALAKTVSPDEAFAGFDRFIAELPSGVQLFSVLRQQPAMIDLVSSIMGTAPRLARVLSKHARVLDAVLDPGFFGSIAEADALRTIVRTEMSSAADLEAALDRARVVGNEQSFLIGVRVLTGTISAADAGTAYATLADELLAALAERVGDDMTRAHGSVLGGATSVIAMGKLGGREMTATSDLDLIVVYDFDPTAQTSTGPRPLPPTQYYGRYTQRLINTFTAPTAQGALYEVDMRLRPSGQKGPVATQFASFVDYQSREAWTWEHLALTRARVVSSSPNFAARINTAIKDVLTRPRDRVKIATDVRDMRQRIADAKGTDDIWNLKQVRGGLVDLEFIAQYLQLINAAEHPEVLDQNTREAFIKLRNAGLLAPDAAARLITATRLLHDLTQILRLSFDGTFEPTKAPDGLRRLLAQVGSAPTFEILVAELTDVQKDVAALFETLVA
ncbi:MAG: bifunctional [glutamine synthetase] adenylyltransferase/[glutamine synthetase]-adenylyl-L-tyrosine phosphorylase [Hyphomicrobiaceae bacterium]